jgi:hypothetical protein
MENAAGDGDPDDPPEVGAEEPDDAGVLLSAVLLSAVLLSAVLLSVAALLALVAALELLVALPDELPQATRAAALSTASAATPSVRALRGDLLGRGFTGRMSPSIVPGGCTEVRVGIGLRDEVGGAAGLLKISSGEVGGRSAELGRAPGRGRSHGTQGRAPAPDRPARLRRPRASG